METLYITESSTNENVVRKVTQGDSYPILVEKIYLAENKPQGYNGTIASILWMYFAKTSKVRNKWRRNVLKSLFLKLYDEHCFEVLQNVNYVEVVYNVSAFGNRFIRDLEYWKPTDNTPVEEQLKSLIVYCFAKYDTPMFLITSFFGTQKKYMLWYVQLGVGRSVMSLDGIPFGFTKRMAFEFIKTPIGLDVSQALVRAQAIVYGAKEKQITEMIWSSLVSIEVKEKFWKTVLQFFSTRETTFNIINQIIAYLSYCVKRDPSYSMKGRTLDVLKRQSAVWYEEVFSNKEINNVLRWKSIGMQGFDDYVTIGGKEQLYKIVELLDSQALYEEGDDMKHCVASYTDECYNGESAIFSMRKYKNNRLEKLATIEIEPATKQLIEVQGAYNEMISNEAKMVLEKWMQIEAITIEKPIVNEYVEESFGLDYEYLNARREGLEATNSDIKIPVGIVLWIIWIVFKLLMIL